MRHVGPGDEVMDPTRRVENSMFRALAWLRLVLAVFVVAQFVLRGLTAAPAWSDLRHGSFATATMVVLAAWTVLMAVLHLVGRTGRTVLVGDLLVTALLMLSSRWLLEQPTPATIPGFWVMGAVFAWSVRWGAWAGALSALVIGAADLVAKPLITSTTYESVFLLVMAGAVVGSVASVLKELLAEREQIQRRIAALDERTRLARVVHDGVLQVLALTQRRGTEAGGEWAELGRLAGEQERQLRTFVQRGVPRAVATRTDLADVLADAAAADVTVSVPGEVLVPETVAREVAAAVAACISNTRLHAPGAHVWVAIEPLVEGTLVSIRDDGPGIPDGRVETAQAQGRMGIAQSISGRMHDIGGRADLTTGLGRGTEWELRLPVES